MIHIIPRASFIEDYIGFSINALWGNLIYCKYAQFSRGKAYTCQSGKGSENINKQISVKTNNEGRRYPKTTLSFNVAKTKLHPTQKPVALLEYLIKTYTLENETVLDFTAGSFSTGVACVNLNRKFVGIEKDDRYFEIGSNRVKEAIDAKGASWT